MTSELSARRAGNLRYSRENGPMEETMAATVDRLGAGVASGALPFDARKLDALMEAAGFDARVVSTRHNNQYQLGGDRFFFFDRMDAIGVGRYLPLLIYVRGRPEAARYIGDSMERYEHELGRFWTPGVGTAPSGALGGIAQAVAHLNDLGAGVDRIGIEPPFLPSDAFRALQEGLPAHAIGDALVVLERLRAHKTPEELALMREASDRVVASMRAVFAAHGPGVTKRELVQALRREEHARGLTFEYCLITAGTSLNRAPSDQRLAAGDILSLDSGASYRGYIGDLCRMGIMGEPDAELVDLLGLVEEIQQAARQPVRPGALGREIYEAATPILARSGHAGYTDFVAHGIGLVSHEAPRLTSVGPVPYSDDDAEKPLEAGYVLSIETTMHHPRRGFVKLEDTVAVTAGGHEAFGDAGRGWNRCGG
jgi:Xaa-Pro aminopeptidase